MDRGDTAVGLYSQQCSCDICVDLRFVSCLHVCMYRRQSADHQSGEWTYDFRRTHPTSPSFFRLGRMGEWESGRRCRQFASVSSDSRFLVSICRSTTSHTRNRWSQPFDASKIERVESTKSEQPSVTVHSLIGKIHRKDGRSGKLPSSLCLVPCKLSKGPRPVISKDRHA